MYYLRLLAIPLSTMNLMSVTVAVSLLFGVASAILGGQVVPIGTKTYTVGIRTTANGESFCGGALIAPSYVISSAHCEWRDVEYVTVGSHYINGSEEGVPADGEQIKIEVHHMHPKFDLNATDDKKGVWGTTMGWGVTSTPDGDYSLELKSVKLQVWGDKECKDVFSGVQFPSFVCAGGVAGKDACAGDMGDPLIRENQKGDADDILIGLNSVAMIAV
ncbi:Peptidase S1, PA clan [Phytophthora cactorum]|nr:Peptidase S1, PA clan [Phytophthora cactorum]